MCRRLHHCQTSVVALITCCQAGVIAHVGMALFPLMCRRVCHHCYCNCCPHDDGIIAIVNAQASLLLWSWHCCPHNNSIVTLDLQRRCCPCCDGVVAIFKLALLPLLQWGHCHHQCHCPCCSPASWHHCRQCAGLFANVAMAIVALVTMVLSPLSMHRRLCHC